MSNYLEKTRPYRPPPSTHDNRPWDLHRSSSASSASANNNNPLPPTPHQQLPSISDLTSGLPPSHHASLARSLADTASVHSAGSIRDSGNWSMQSPSKHTSVISTGSNSLQLPSISNGTGNANGHGNGPSHERSSPQRSSTASGNDDRPVLFSPSYSSRPSIATTTSALSPTSEYPRSTLSSTFETASRNSGADYPPEVGTSRRSSIDSRMNQGMNSLALGGAASPYPGSANQSQASLTSSLQRERGIGHRIRPDFGTPKKAQSILGIHSMAESQRRFPGGRIAPPIDSNPRSQWPNPHAANPTKGFPYAFPDPDAEVIHEDEEHVPMPSTEPPPPPRMERRPSFGAVSVASSVFTNDSRMPHGQRKLEESAISSPIDPDSANLHHHQLHNKQLGSLMDDDEDGDMGPNGSTPYSRTPELRVSHKLAERKRRSEMKHLFEELRQRIPADGRVNKASKWEVLVKAIDYIKQLESTCNETQRHALHWRNEANEAHALRSENLELRAEMQRLTASMQHQQSSQSQQQSSQVAPPPAGPPPAPPAPAQSAGAMQGVQYGA